MLNKKNISVVAAGMMAATSFGTAFAAPQSRAIVDSTQESEINAIKEKVAEMFTVKFTEEAALLTGNKAIAEGKVDTPVYTIGIEGSTPGDYTDYDNYAAFEKAFDAKYAALKSGETIRVRYIEAANRVLDNGQIVDSVESTYAAADFDKDAQTIKGGHYVDGSTGDDATMNTVSFGRKIEVEQKADNTFVGKIQISDENGEERFITVKEGDVKLDLTRPIYRQVNGYYVDANNTPIKKVDNKVIETSITNGVIDGYYASTLDTTGLTAKTSYDAIVKDEVMKVELNASKLYEFYDVNEGRLTKEGNEIFKALKETDAKTNYEVVLDGSATDKNVLNVNKINPVTNAKTLVATITIKDDQPRKDVDAYSFLTDNAGRNLLDLATTGTTTNLEINIAAGTDRYETAVELAKKEFTRSVNEVVLVSGANDKLVDGLTATPLAATLNSNSGAPVLLTKAGELPKSVVEYLQDVNTTKVYIVGGDSAVNKSVETELKNRYGIAVERIEGKDRYETSINVAKAVQDKNEKTDDTAYVVGGRAEADALSISAKAGADKQPIVLVPQSGMSSEIKYALKGIANAHIIGGENSVSDVVAQELVDAGVTTVTRTKGDNRQETNAAVIAKFHSSAAAEIVYAKSNDAGLVDALGAGAYAAKNNAPLVLATNSLTESQEDALQPHKAATAKTQAGYGIKDVVAKFIANLK